MTDRLKGKLAFCTASGAGIGRATATAFAREGAKVIASDLNEAAMAGLKEVGVADCVKLDAQQLTVLRVGRTLQSDQGDQIGSLRPPQSQAARPQQTVVRHSVKPPSDSMAEPVV